MRFLRGHRPHPVRSTAGCSRPIEMLAIEEADHVPQRELVVEGSRRLASEDPPRRVHDAADRAADPVARDTEDVRDRLLTPPIEHAERHGMPETPPAKI